MAVVSESTAPTAAAGTTTNSAGLDQLEAKVRSLTFREDLNDTRFTYSDDEDDFSDDESTRDPETKEIAILERKALKYRKSLTMLHGHFAGMTTITATGNNASNTSSTPTSPVKTPSIPTRLLDDGNGGVKKDSHHWLAAKKSMDDLTAWINAGSALDGDDDDEDPFAGDA